MKLLVTLYTVALVGHLVAAPRLHLSEKLIQPGGDIEIILDYEAATAEQVGREASKQWLKIEPAWSGKTVWKEANVLSFKPSEAPALGVSYRFSLVGGHKHLDGTEVPAGKVGVGSTPVPGVVYTKLLHRYESGWSPRTANYYVQFNGDVEPTEANRFLQYVDKSGRQVAAKARRATFGELRHEYLIRASFREKFLAALNGESSRPELTPEFEVSSGLIVEPDSPLPVGDEWRLVILEGLPVEGSKMPKSKTSRVGDVSPLSVQKMYAHTVVDQPRRIVIDFSLDLTDDFDVESVRIEPELPDMTVVRESDKLIITGDFSHRNNWTVYVDKGIVSFDGRLLSKSATEKVEFKHLAPAIVLPSDDETQLASGSRFYRVKTENIDSLRVRIKRLEGKQLVRAQQGYRHYTQRNPNGEPMGSKQAIPYELMMGETVTDLTIPMTNEIDTSQEMSIDWDKVRGGDSQPYVLGKPSGEPREVVDARPGAYFIEVFGQPKSKASPKRSVAAQALVQLTDLGIAWKMSEAETAVLVFSCQTGQPLEGVDIQLFGEDAVPLPTARTNAHGIAHLPRDERIRHLRAVRGDDQVTLPLDTALPTVNMWRFPVRYSWSPPPLKSRRVMLFADRSLYRPGEMVHVKGIVRTQNGNVIESSPKGETVRLTVVNPTENEVVSQDIEISASGSFDHSFRLPSETTGNHRVVVEWTDELEAAEKIEDWWERRSAENQAQFTLALRVEDFRRNAFEIRHDLAPPEIGAKEVTLALDAEYFHGQPVAKGEVDVWKRVTERNFYPERYRDYLFGDHRTPDYGYWQHYFGYNWGNYGHNSQSSEVDTEQLELDDEGSVEVAASISEIEFPRARTVSIQTEVTDANRQTLTKTSRATVHPASVYIGVKRLDRLVRVGDRLPLEIMAVDTAGKSFSGELEIEATLSREVNEQVRIRSDNGRSAVRNEKRDEPLSRSTLQLAEGHPTEYLLAPENPGRHMLELRGKDEAGRPFATAMTVHVYGSSEYPWAYEDGMRIKLVPEKTLYRPGDTARLLVLSPIKGKALVTVEREQVTHSFLTELDPQNPVVEIPVGHDDAPNCYVSVLVIKGAQDSARKFKEPQLRLGYCELTVENQRDRLAVEVDSIEGDFASEPHEGEAVSLLPGSDMTVAGRVLKSDGKPASGAEITLYAEDEGTLAVVGYQTPDPMAHFYDPRILRVHSGTSLGNFIPESPDEQMFSNKGVFIGGGGGPMQAPIHASRKNFDPCAFWYPAVTTDADGRFEITAKLPDTLTRYRLIAVAHQGASRFGHAEEEFTVNKPLMVEPQVPRFAHQGDSLEMRALIQNASELDGVWEIVLIPNPPASEPVSVLADGVGDRAIVRIAAGRSAQVGFPVDFKNTGKAVMQWRATPVSLAGRAPLPEEQIRHADRVESTFQVEYPVPLMRQTRLIRLGAASKPHDLLAGLDPKLLAGRGHIDIEISRSLLLEAAGSINYLLRYPYGCVEQTTSSLIPWLAVERLRAVSPELAKHHPDEVEDAISQGVERLISMQQSDGGFGYWPQSGGSSRWSSSYAAMGLIMAHEHQKHHHQGAIDRACKFLVRQLRHLDDDSGSHELEIAARDLWVLAMAGKPQDAYVNKMRDWLPRLNDRARCFLALAEAEAKDVVSARAILESDEPRPDESRSWMRWQPTDALSLLAWNAVDPKSDEAVKALDRLLNNRNPYGHWRTTWVNAWSLIALGSVAEHESSHEKSTTLVLDRGQKSETIELSAGNPLAARSIALHPGIKLQAAPDGPAYVRIELAAKPEIAPLQPVAKNGMEITRFYQRVHADGSTEPMDTPKIGDLVQVELRVTLPDDDMRYLVIEDRLPANFEAVNQTFKSQAANMNAGSTSQRSWKVSHHEIKDEKVMFFYDRIYRRGTTTLTYLARCTLEGETYAPPAKVESMYDPDQIALSASRIFEVK